ncbi:MAG: hypothetical protein AB7F35_15550 [Acetobacteraceae bacterium]
MKAKRLEVILGTGLRIGPAEMVQRFQRLRDNRMLPTSRGRNAEDLTTEGIVFGLLSVVDERPGFAALTAKTLGYLQPVGGVAGSFAEASSLRQALITTIENQALLDSIREIRLTNSEIYTNSFGRSAIFYSAERTENVTYYVEKTAITLLQRGAKQAYDPRAQISSMIREIVIYPRVLKDIVKEIRDRETYAQALASNDAA